MGYGCTGQYIWEKTPIPQWDILIKELDTLLDDYISVAGENISTWGSDTVKNLYSASSIKRFVILKSEMIEAFAAYKDNLKPDAPMKQWILLGAVLEIVLQIFLTVYYPDYLKEKWQQWDNIDEDAVHNCVNNLLKDMVKDKKITSDQRKSLVKAIDGKIAEHSEVHEVSHVMLDELIALYTKARIFEDSDYVDCFRIIQKNRNCIHAYAERVIDGWDNLLQSANMFGCIVSEMKYRSPTLADV